MKLNKLIYPLMLVLAATLGTTGCKHKPIGITPLPTGPAMVGEAPANPLLPRGSRVNPEHGPDFGNGPIPLPVSGEEINNMIADRTALAPDTIHFKFDSSVIQSTERSKLVMVAEALKSDSSAKLLVEGNCDERGTPEYNLSLGERRALAAREALAKQGIDPMRIFTRSYGKDKPVANGHDEASWTQNRRDDFVLLHPKP